MSLAYTEYCLQNIKDNTNFESDFLPDVDLFSASLYMTIYSRIMLNITLKVANVYKTSFEQVNRYY